MNKVFPGLLFLAATILLIFVFANYKTGAMHDHVGMSFMASAFIYVSSAIAWRLQNK